MKTIATHLRRHRPTVLGIAVCASIALAATVFSLYSVSFAPPGLEARSLEQAGASTRVLIDPVDSAITSRHTVTTTFESLTKRASLLSQVMAGGPVREYIGRRAGIPAADIAAIARITENVPSTLTEPDSEARADEIEQSRKPYRLDIQPRPALPIIDIYAQAPTPAEAERLADGAVAGLRDFIAAEADAHHADPEDGTALHQLGPAEGAVINGGAKLVIGGLTFLLSFALAGGLWLGIKSARRGWISAAPGAVREETAARSGGGGGMAPAQYGVALSSAGGAALRPGVATWPSGRARIDQLRSAVTYAGDWPRTTRLLPWSIAAFMAMLWLVPFNQIALAASLPIDMKLDRMILPFIFVLWVLSLASGGPGAPRLRFTGIHAGLAIFAAVALISVVLDAPYLNQILELDLAIKKLTLLFSYFWLFVIVASVIRYTEVKPFLIFTLILSVICAVGTIWEYRFLYNVFYDVSDALLPGFFTVGQAESAGVDEIGRRLVRGPAEIGLEAVAMFTMALPIALVGVMHAKERRHQILYGLAACLLLAAAISTYRKSAFLGPISVGLTLAYFRRRELMKLAPLALVLLVVVHALSPGAIGSILFQLDANRLGVATVSDRASDYDAVRPDLWTHMAFGRGYGTYEHAAYRVLDSEILNRVLEVGIVGLAAYVVMILSVVVVARGPIRSRDPVRSPVALAVAAAAVGFLVLSTLFDVMSFPHVPYIFLYLAGLLAVVLRPPDGVR